MGANDNLQVSYANGSYQIGDQVNNCYQPCDDYWYRQYYTQWYPVTHTVYVESKVDKAFKVVTHLIDKGFITKEMKVKTLMEMVNSISELL